MMPHQQRHELLGGPVPWSKTSSVAEDEAGAHENSKTLNVSRTFEGKWEVGEEQSMEEGLT